MSVLMSHGAQPAWCRKAVKRHVVRVHSMHHIAGQSDKLVALDDGTVE